MCCYLDWLDSIETAARRPMLICCVNLMLGQSHIDCTKPPPTIGHNWPKRFLDAHLKYYIRKQKLLAVERKNSHEPSTIQH